MNAAIEFSGSSLLASMSKKTLSSAQLAALVLVAALTLSCFSGLVGSAKGQTQPDILATQQTGSAAEIAALEASVEAHGGWTRSLQTIYDGIALGQTTAADLQNAVDSINVTSTSVAEEVFYWYFELEKLGVTINETTIEAALNAVTMLPGIGGLPDDYSNSGVASFLLYNRYDLYAYQWATQLDYETSKWNLTQAYTVFNNSVNTYGEPVLCVGSDGKGWGISYGPRYYDESAETIDMYLTFWQLGIPDGLAQAERWWNWTTANLWVMDSSTGTGYYEYAKGWNTFECETGGFDQIIWKLYNADPTISNVTTLLTDLGTRFLSQGWSSPQWETYVVQHAVGNAQERLENTIMSWASLIGFYGDMDGAMQSQVQSLLNGSTGPAPAWSLLLQSQLYDSSTGMFKLHSDSSDSVEATADAAVLVMLLSTVPVGGSLAVPLEDCVYEDINNIIDGSVSNINVTSRVVTLSVASPGTFLSTFGTNIFQYTLNSPGIWQLTFTSDWNNITSATLISPLPSSRQYLGLETNTPFVYASSDQFATINPSGRIYVGYGQTQTFTYSANNGYVINQVLVDGEPVAVTGSYTFTDIQEPHNITVFSSPAATQNPTPTPPPNTPTPTPTASPTPTPSQQTQNPTATPTATPTPSPSPQSSPPLSTHLTLILEASAFVVAVLLVASLTVSQYSKKRKAQRTSSTYEKTPSQAKTVML